MVQQTTTPRMIHVRLPSLEGAGLAVLGVGFVSMVELSIVSRCALDLVLSTVNVTRGALLPSCLATMLATIWVAMEPSLTLVLITSATLATNSFAANELAAWLFGAGPQVPCLPFLLPRLVVQLYSMSGLGKAGCPFWCARGSLAFPFSCLVWSAIVFYA